jgi:hypothetical protein
MRVAGGDGGGTILSTADTRVFLSETYSMIHIQVYIYVSMCKLVVGDLRGTDHLLAHGLHRVMTSCWQVRERYGGSSQI